MAYDNGGGGLRLRSGGTIINSTFYNNTEEREGGGIGVEFNDTDAGTPGIQTSPFILQNSILVGNTARNVANGHQIRVSNMDAANVVTLQHNLIAGGADPMGTDQGVVYTTPGSGNITEENTVDESDVAVVFASTDAMNTNYLRLAAGSPAVNVGNNLYLNNGTPGNLSDDITTDVAGETRIQNGTVDLGAYESDLKAAQTITFTAPADDGMGSVGTVALTATTNAAGLFVSFSIETTPDGIATLTNNGDGTGTLVITGGGTVVVTASHNGDETYEAAVDVMRTITIQRVEATIFRVTTTGAGNQSGDSWTNAMALQEALVAAFCGRRPNLDSSR